MINVEASFDDYWATVLRRRWLIICIVATAMLIASALCVVLPRTYRSMTTVLVEGQKIPESYVKSVVGGTIEERLTSIKQIVMSRSLLLQIAEEYQLLSADKSPEEKEEYIASMRKSLKVDTVDSPGVRGRTIEAFSISFAHEDPVTAMKVTQRFASQFIEQNLKIREQLVEGASDFLEQELRMAQERLEAQEQRISDFKKKNIGELPQQIEANLRSLDRIQLEINSSSDAIQNVIARLSLIEKDINEYKATGKTVSAGETGQVNQGRIDPLMLRLVELERGLAILKAADYKDNYPDVVAARQEMQEVRKQLAEKYGVPQEEAKQGSIHVFDPVLKELIRQREDARIELDGLRERQKRLQVQRKLLEGRVERTPSHEQDLMILVRDYENMQKNYQALLEKKLNARVAENLEKRQKGEQFRIIDPANLPVAPEKPNRPLILVAGTILGCGFGFGTAFALDLLRPAFRRPDEAETMLGLPVLASIPAFSSVFAGKESLRRAASNSELRKLLPGSQTAEVSRHVIKRSGDLQSASWNLVSKWSPRSMVCEQFRVAATRLSLMTSEQKSTVVLITSALVGEGKTSTAVNLSYVLAQELDKSTLLIDCDLKRPMVHAYSDTSQSPGLIDYLQGDQPLDACIHKMDDVPLWVLPTGTSGKGVLELSKIKQLSKIIHDLRPRFDYILIDAPPILPLADLNVLSSMGDLMILVIRAGRTGREVVGQAYKSLRSGCPAGIVLTGVDSISTPYYMYDYGHLDSGTAKRA